MGPNPESAGITAQQRFHYLRVSKVSPIELVFFWMNLKLAGKLCPRKPDSSEIHPTPRRDQYLPTEEV